MSTYVFDLDGTICTQENYNNYRYAFPIEPMIEKIRVLHTMGNKIIIFTARGMNTFSGDIKKIEDNLRGITEQWLKIYDVPYDQLIFGKPAADFYIDDKGISAHDFISKTGKTTL